MAEPKPQADAGESTRKKPSSKKSAKLSAPPSDPSPTVPSLGPVSQLSTSSSPVPKLHEIPRIQLAEPKPAASNDGPGTSRQSKPRASKKKSSGNPEDAGPRIASDTQHPQAVAPGKEPVDPAKEAEAIAKKEAKRQRAKEKEEARKREERLNQEREEERRREEQRQREIRRQQELAELNANAEECQEEPDDDDQNEYGDDDFEDYADDFEEPPSDEPSTSSINKQTQQSSVDTAALQKVRYAQQAETKELQQMHSSSKLPVSNDQPSEKRVSEPKARSSSISHSIAGLKQSLDPRAKRVRSILETRKMEVEKFHLYQQAPQSDLDKYMNRLRRGRLRQTFAQTNDNAKSSGTQTYQPQCKDKSMHFPDDVGLDATNENSSDDVKSNQNSTGRFFRFLDMASQVCELLAENNCSMDNSSLDTTRDSTRTSISSINSMMKLQTLPNKKMNDELIESLLTGRDLCSLQFATEVSNILVACYGPQTSVEEKENEYPTIRMWKDKSISCVWDMNQLDSVFHVLKSEGITSASCISPLRELFILTGTDDGSIHVWDLRQNRSFHGPSTSTSVENKKVEDQIIFRLPSYSTCALDANSAAQHSSSIVSMETFSRFQATSGNSRQNDMVSFQFGSLDDRGIVIIWSLIEFEKTADALTSDKCVEIGGCVKMIMNAIIDVNHHCLTSTALTRLKVTKQSGSRQSKSDDPEQSVGSIASLLRFFPTDSNQFVVGTNTGRLLRGHRFRNNSKATTLEYRRCENTTLSDSSGVTTIDFHPFDSIYFLAGYSDGMVCLYRSDRSVCLTCWSEAEFGESVCTVQWSRCRPSVFYASYSDGSLRVWDLLTHTHISAYSHDIPRLTGLNPVATPPSLYPIALSSTKNRIYSPSIAFRSGDCSSFQFAVCTLEKEHTQSFDRELEETKRILSHIL